VKNFSWLIPGKLAGSEKPGFHTSDEEGDLAFLYAQGVRALVTLTEDPVDRLLLARAGLSAIHIPIPNLEPPELEQVDAFARFVDESGARDEAVVAHCLYGIGRTGTMLACYLVHQGRDSGAAIAEVRRVRPGSIETNEQAARVSEFAKRLRARGR